MLIDVTAILIFHFQLYIPRWKADDWTVSMLACIKGFIFSLFKASKGKCEESHRGALDTRVFAYLQRYKYNARYYLKSALFVLQ